MLIVFKSYSHRMFHHLNVLTTWNLIDPHPMTDFTNWSEDWHQQWRKIDHSFHYEFIGPELVVLDFWLSLLFFWKSFDIVLRNVVSLSGFLLAMFHHNQRSGSKSRIETSLINVSIVKDVCIVCIVCIVRDPDSDHFVMVGMCLQAMMIIGMVKAGWWFDSIE